MSAFVLWCSVVLLVYFASTVPFTQAIQCQGTAKYTLTFQAEWTSQSHPNDFPSGSGPHFSVLVGCSHKADYVMWKPGINATTGVKNVAELGTPRALNNEMDVQIRLNKAFKKYEGTNSFISNTGTSTIENIEVNSEFPLVSFITMIAPSPDWFVGVRDFNLCNKTTGKWLDSRARDLPLYDAGTDSGLRFTSANQITDPTEVIHRITNNTKGSLESDKPLKRFGTFTFVKTSEINPKMTSSSPPPSPSNTTSTSSSAIQTTPTGTANQSMNLNAILVLMICIFNICH